MERVQVRKERPLCSHAGFHNLGAGIHNLAAHPVRQWIHFRKPESEQLPLPGGHSIPVLSNNRLHFWFLAESTGYCYIQALQNIINEVDLVEAIRPRGNASGGS